jgi:hypothetical protein
MHVKFGSDKLVMLLVAEEKKREGEEEVRRKVSDFLLSIKFPFINILKCDGGLTK